MEIYKKGASMKVNTKATGTKEATDVIERLKNSYDELVYPSKSFGVTSINSLEAKAILLVKLCIIQRRPL